MKTSSYLIQDDPPISISLFVVCIYLFIFIFKCVVVVGAVVTSASVLFYRGAGIWWKTFAEAKAKVDDFYPFNFYFVSFLQALMSCMLSKGSIRTDFFMETKYKK